MRLRYAKAYLAVRCVTNNSLSPALSCSNAKYSEYSAFSKTDFSSVMRPEFLWWAQIPFGGSGFYSGI